MAVLDSLIPVLQNIANLGLDSTYTIGIKGDGKSNQNGSFNARIATTGDVAISERKTIIQFCYQIINPLLLLFNKPYFW